MADIINTDNGSVAAGKVNDKLATAITSADQGSEWASKVNAKTSAGYITESDNGSTFATKIANAGGGEGTTLRVLTLNVGHYADGLNNNPSFNAQTYADYVGRFTDFLDYIDADIICVQEYSEYVYQSNAAKDVLFGDYPYYFIGKTRAGSWACSAVFSKIPFVLLGEIDFTHRKNSISYILLEMEIDGHTVGIVNTHMDTTNGGDNYRFEQFGEIVDALKGYDYAIFGADTNIARVQDDGLGAGMWNYINYWVNGGSHDCGGYGIKNFGNGYGGGEYTLANNAVTPVGTWPTTRCTTDHVGYQPMDCPCDGISVKGFSISNIKRLDSADTPSNDLTDHCAFYCDLTLIDNE